MPHSRPHTDAAATYHTPGLHVSAGIKAVGTDHGNAAAGCSQPKSSKKEQEHVAGYTLMHMSRRVPLIPGHVRWGHTSTE